MRRFTDQFVAVFVAVLINAALFWVLANGVQHSLTATDTDERAVMQVVWLTRPSVGQAPPRVMVAKRSATSAPENRRRQQAQRPTVESPQTTTSTSVLDVVGDDQWTPNALGGATESPDTSLFVRDPLKRRPARMEASQDRLHLTFTDRSFGGVLKRMTQRDICGELRRSLDSTSAEAALASMRKYGCNH